MRQTLVGAALMIVACARMAVAQQAPPSSAQPHDSEALAKQLSNPVSSLVSVPFQFNWEQGVGPQKLTRFVLNVQPVIPMEVNKDWNVILRIIIPFLGQPPLTVEGVAASGISDVTTSFFLSPAKSSGLTWGAGPVIVLPSTSEPTLGSGKFSAGPTAIVLKQAGRWTVGALWNQTWSFSGDPARDDVNQMFLQPFLAHQLTKTVTVTLQSETVANWNASGEQWTVPVMVSVAKLSAFGSFPASYQFGVAGYAVHPEGGPTWKVRGAVVVLLPSRSQ